ncbi:MAG: hypothetical protein IPJ65_28415 [Archangiaceae bacterium]|nr:hypothetical protein [Archangiaceae bacterium]
MPHPWLAPEHNAVDLAHLNTMLARLRTVLAPPAAVPEGARPLFLNFVEPDGRGHRIVIARHEPLLQPATFSFVGFFGLKSATADGDELNRVDLQLIDEFPQNPYLLTYSSLELTRGGQWGNLVLFARPDAVDAWREGPRHRRAVDELAPKSYAAVRLHNGTLEGGLEARSRLTVSGTKHYDYSRAG